MEKKEMTRDQFQQEYEFTDWEADVMQEELEKLADRIAQEE